MPDAYPGRACSDLEDTGVSAVTTSQNITCLFPATLRCSRTWFRSVRCAMLSVLITTMTTTERLKKAKALLKRAEAEIRTVTTEALVLIDRNKLKKQRLPQDIQESKDAVTRCRLCSVVTQQIENTRLIIIDNFPGVHWHEKPTKKVIK
jgi:elongation factor P--beta-lysine ligase